MAANRALLEQLMGATRNLTAAEKAKLKTETISWRDESICKLYICGFCPHDTFLNSKFDLWPCTKKHNDEAKAQFEKEPLPTRMMVERGWIAFAEDRVIRPCDRRVAAAEARVAASNAGTAVGTLAVPGAATAAAAMSEIEKKIAASPEVIEIDTKLVALQQNVSVLQTQIAAMKTAAAAAAATAAAAAAAAPAAGAAGAAGTAGTAVAAAPVSSIATDALQKLIDGLAAERVQLEQKRTDIAVALNGGKPLSALMTPALAAADKYAAANAALQRNLSVCKTCASLIKLDDTEERLRDHREGKLHASFEKVRTQAAAYATTHKALLTAGTVTETQLRAAAHPPGAPLSDRVAPAGRPGYDAPHGGSEWRGDWRGAPQGAGGYPQHQYRDPRDTGYDHHRGYDDRRYGGSSSSSRYDPRERPAESAHSSSHRSSRRSSRSRSRSRDRDRKHRRRSRSRSASSGSRSSRSRSSHKKSSGSRSSRHRSHSASPSSSRSRSRSRSGSRHRKSSKSSRHKSSRRSGSRSRSRSRDRKSKDKKKERGDRSDKDKDKKRSKKDGSREKTTEAATTAAAAAPEAEAGEIGEITAEPAAPSASAAAAETPAGESKMQDTDGR